MSQELDFYFDYSSPYGYLASERVETIADKHDLAMSWHPILLGAIFKITNQAPLTEAPLKGEYSVMDFHRSAREHKISFQQPDPFPIAAIAASRATLWVRNHEDPDVAAKVPGFIHGVYRSYYVAGQDITDLAVLKSVAETTGLDSKAMLDAISEQSIKDALRDEVNQAIEHGVFGSPTIVIDKEQFWGHDRLDQLDRWLDSGGW
ncbi:MAG: 2-hydroxychromene-2-carboxylate isomerase [Granulosicoccus sp.]|nr:2-hydroxychromene-2-carboxylate isomerase [Granulosicoccus sp.]